MTAMEHVRHLVETIGPRGSATEKERRAADYVRDQLSKMGLSPVVETFRSARSAWLPPALFWSLLLVAGFLFLGSGRFGAILGLVIAASGLGSMLLELLFRSNPLRWILPIGEGTNAWARIPASADPREHVALVAHLDTHRTPLAFSSDGWIRAFERLVPFGMVWAVVLLVLLVLGVIYPFPWLRYAAAAPMVVSFGMMLLMLQADFTPYAPGANDNASGVGVVLSVAERLARIRLPHTTVWVVCTGCEEVGAYGADDFLRRHRAELGSAAWIVVDTVGSQDGHPIFLSQETFLGKTVSDPALLDGIRDVAATHPQLGVREARMKGAYTDAAIGHKYGQRVLTVLSHQPSGTLSHWHRPTDTIENVSVDCMAAAELLLVRVLDHLDKAAASN